jgi:hypothetical protein
LERAAGVATLSYKLEKRLTSAKWIDTATPQ